ATTAGRATPRRSPMARDGVASIESTASQAEGLLAQGRLSEAERHYRELVGQTHVIDYEYDDWLRRLGEIYTQLQRPLEAGFVYLYLRYFDLARSAFSSANAEIERARVLEIEKRWAEAADIYAAVGMPVHLAVAHEKAGNAKAAARAWDALIKDASLRD